MDVARTFKGKGGGGGGSTAMKTNNYMMAKESGLDIE